VKQDEVITDDSSTGEKLFFSTVSFLFSVTQLERKNNFLCAVIRQDKQKMTGRDLLYPNVGKV